MPPITPPGLTFSLTPIFLILLRLAPALSTTASSTHAYMEHLTTSSFLTPAPLTSSLSHPLLRDVSPTPSPRNSAELAAAKDLVIPAWFVNFFNRAVWSVIGLNSITVISASANLWFFGAGLGQSRKYYVTGLVGAAAHYLFVPVVGKSVLRLFAMYDAHEKGEDVERDGKGRIDAVQNLEEWVGWHKIRMGSVDVVAWVAFVIGAVNVLAS